MKVFISWSGERSRYIAAALRDWLPNVIQSLEPWMSDKDIDGGSRWLLTLSGQLNESMTGILCVTPENQSNPWLVFEAGALSKTIGQTMVCPLLYDLESAQLTGPLSQFQAKTLDRASVLSILNTLNTSMTIGKLTPERLERAFSLCWPELDAKLKTVPTSEASHAPKRKADDILEEILTIVRDHRRLLQSQRVAPFIEAMRQGRRSRPLVALGPRIPLEVDGYVKSLRTKFADNDALVAEELRRSYAFSDDTIRDLLARKYDSADSSPLGNEGKYD